MIAVQRIGVVMVKVLAACVEQQTCRERNQAFGVVVITVQRRQIVVVVDVIEVVASSGVGGAAAAVDSRLIVDIGGGTRNVIRADVEVCVILIFLVGFMLIAPVVIVERQILIMRLDHQGSLLALALANGLVVTVKRDNI